MTGYLTKADPEEEGDTVALKIPNAEIAGLFQEAVVSLFKDTLDTSRQKTFFWRGNRTITSRESSAMEPSVSLSGQEKFRKN